MRKDKPGKKTNMMDLIHEEGQRNPPKKNFDEKGIIQTPPTPLINDERLIKEEQKLKNYNKKVKELDPMYAEGLKPVTKIIVRCFVNEPTRTGSGLILKHSHKVRIPTQSGVGTVESVESPWPYSKLAVVVSMPDGYDNLAPGDLVQLGDEPVKAIAMEQGKGAAIGIKNSFTHHSYISSEPPSDIESPHYGYLLIQYHQIECKINV